MPVLRSSKKKGKTPNPKTPQTPKSKTKEPSRRTIDLDAEPGPELIGPPTTPNGDARVEAENPVDAAGPLNPVDAVDPPAPNANPVPIDPVVRIIETPLIGQNCPVSDLD